MVARRSIAKQSRPNRAAPAKPRAAKKTGAAVSAENPKRARILEAGLDIFEREGFSAARMEDIANRAGVAKGTVYLYAPNKEALFNEILSDAMGPALDRLRNAAVQPLPPGLDLVGAFPDLVRQIHANLLTPKRRRVLRLLIREGSRFPKIAKFYHDSFIREGMNVIRTLAASMPGRPFASDISRHPQIITAPFLMLLIWEGLFGNFTPIDEPDLLESFARMVQRAMRELP